MAKRASSPKAIGNTYLVLRLIWSIPDSRHYLPGEIIILPDTTAEVLETKGSVERIELTNQPKEGDSQWLK